MLVFLAIPITQEDLLKHQQYFAAWINFANNFIGHFQTRQDPHQHIAKMFRRIYQCFDRLRECRTVPDYLAIYPRVQAATWRMNEFIRSGPFPV